MCHRLVRNREIYVILLISSFVNIFAGAIAFRKIPFEMSLISKNNLSLECRVLNLACLPLIVNILKCCQGDFYL